MSIITIIAGIPLYTTPQEALDWAKAKGLDGYHTHNFQGQTGYMGGITHAIATQSLTTSTQPTTQRTTSSGSGGY